MAKTKVKKNATANTGKFAYSYTDLAAIHEELEKQGTTYYQYIEYDKDADADYIYTVIVSEEGKESTPRRGCRVVLGANPNPAQAQGSGLTYARRYSLLMALGWATEDDDGAGVASAPTSALTTSGRLDFDELKVELAEIHTEADLLRHYNGTVKNHHLSEKQKGAVKKIYGERKDEIRNEDRDWDAEGKARREADEARAEALTASEQVLSQEMALERAMNYGE